MPKARDEFHILLRRDAGVVGGDGVHACHQAIPAISAASARRRSERDFIC